MKRLILKWALFGLGQGRIGVNDSEWLKVGMLMYNVEGCSRVRRSIVHENYSRRFWGAHG